jgi:hypothetical protein
LLRGKDKQNPNKKQMGGKVFIMFISETLVGIPDYHTEKLHARGK